MQLISVEKDWNHVLMQKVVTLNTCCDIACLHSTCHTSQPVLFRATDDNPQLALLRAPTFERTQQAFSQPDEKVLQFTS